MRLTAIACGLLFVLAAFPGCIEFEKQTILVKVDVENDVVHMRLIYEGIYSGDEIEKDLKELNEVSERGTRFYFFDNWPIVVDIGPPEEGEKDNPANALLRRTTTVKNGTFYRNADGKLCAWQDIEFRKASQTLKSLGALVNLAIVTGKADVLDDADDETKTLWKTAALGGHEWFKIDTEGVHFIFPVSDGDAARVKREFLESIIETAVKEASEAEAAEEKEGEPTEAGPGEVSEIEQMVRMLCQNRISWVHEGKMVRFSLGADEDGITRGHAWNGNEGKYVPNLLEPAGEGKAAPKLPAAIDPEMTTEKLLASFE